MPGAFAHALAAQRRRPENRRWIFVPYDQLGDQVGPLSREDPRTLGVVLVECPEKAARRPYHQQKLALVLTSLRHFALEQAARGVAVQHLVAPSYAQALHDRGPLSLMRPAERELRAELEPLIARGQITELPNEGWLSTTEDFRASGGPPWRMDAFYRAVRRRTGILMKGGKPVGGRFSFDSENRRPWRGEPDAPTPPRFEPDAITEEVADLVRTRFGRHPGRLVPETLAATKADVDRAWRWAKERCLPSFGPFEDAMSTASRGLFHAQISSLLNLGRLPAARVIQDALSLDLPLASIEGFVRQILGWREFVRHVHAATDGFRSLGAVAAGPGDGGWSRWRGEPWLRGAARGDGGATPSELGAARPLPPAYWGARSGLRCLDTVVESVWEDGYSHHITRLMILANLATLLDVAPRELTDWFWAAYTDAFDWVVEPNVLGMGTFAAGDRMTTKPYVAGAAYIHKMSDYCQGCRFDPKKSCPITPMYWAFLGRHREALSGVERMKLPLASEARRSAAQRAADAQVFERVSEVLGRGEALEAPEFARCETGPHVWNH
ncbi:MAG: cryptochrome/photolyase family protein [Myxococcota bacterium]